MGLMDRLVEKMPTRLMPQRNGFATNERLWLVVGALTPLVLAAIGWGLRARRGVRVEEVMVRDVLTIDAGAPLIEAARRMRQGNVGALPVVADGRLIGMITDRDLVVRAVADGADPSSARVGDFTTRDPVCVRPETTVDEAMEAMSECQIGRLPVVDPDNRVLGIVTLSSLALRARQRRDALETAQEVSRRSARVA